MESDDADEVPGQFGGMDGSAAQPVQGIMERRNGRAMEEGEPGTDCLPMVHADQGRQSVPGAWSYSAKRPGTLAGHPRLLQ